MQTSFDIVVIGAGHAGVEASLACARMGLKTLLLTLNLDSIGMMPCNPAIGGTGKGHLVREIDALGGEMGLAADDTLIQMRMLNTGKGPAVHSLRAQMDKRRCVFTHQLLIRVVYFFPGHTLSVIQILRSAPKSKLRSVIQAWRARKRQKKCKLLQKHIIVFAAFGCSCRIVSIEEIEKHPCHLLGI